MYSLDLVSDSSAFARLEGEWNDAVERAGIPHPFLRHEWVSAWWEAFGAGRRLHILTVRRSGSIVAIAPLVFERSYMYGLPVRRLRLLHNDHTPRADVIVADRSDATYRALWQGILESSSRWDVLQLNQLVSDSTSAAMFTKFASAEGRLTGVWKSGAAPYAVLPATWDIYMTGLGSKFRQNLRNRFKRLSQIGDPTFEVLSDPSEIKSSCDDAERLEPSGWKHSEGTAIACNPGVRRFYSLLAERASECRWLRLLFLSVNGRRIAASFAAIYDRRLFLLKTGYDPEFAQCSPFKLLTSFAVRHAFESGLTELDFLGDTEPWKLEWTNTTRPHEWLFVFAPTIRGRLLHPLKFQFVPALRPLWAACTSQHSRA
jgi:CelD/BcsL family acetyltransferase involved in cellulose biosynthesis